MSQSSGRVSRPTPPLLEEASTVAAVDLGSNSFHMVVARLADGQLHVVDRLRERVALASGLDEHKQLNKDTEERALRVLGIFGKRLEHMPAGSVRAVGTNTLRQAKNSRVFLRVAEAALGHPIEVISGQEEARLIYQGVARTQEEPERRRLVVDIGGGSTECIIGEGLTPLAADSLYMGCVTFSRFFPEGGIRAEYFDEAVTAAGLELRPIERRYAGLGWSRAVGASGTVTSIENIVRTQGWSNRGITEKSLKRLRKAVLSVTHFSDLDLDGMPQDRAPVLAPGLAILMAIFERFGLERMYASEGALREGLVYDLVGRIQDRDIREQSIRALQDRFVVDQPQADRVEKTALRLLAAAEEGWNLSAVRHRRMLAWAARLYEIGKAISYSGYHKHGGYLIRHSDMPGFSREDQEILSTLVEHHRRKIRTAHFDDLPAGRPEAVLQLALILRLAVVMNRGRSEHAVPHFRLTVKKSRIELRFLNDELSENILLRADLDREGERLAGAGYDLVVGDQRAEPASPL